MPDITAPTKNPEDFLDFTGFIEYNALPAGLEEDFLKDNACRSLYALPQTQICS